jgi:predicted phosphodiesterase
LSTSISEIVKEAFEAQHQAFYELIENASRLLCKEDGKVGNLDIEGRLVKVQPVGEALIIGDLHGDLESLVRIIEESDFLQRLKQDKKAVLIFLGDYGDRGACSAEVYYTVLSLKLMFPKQVVLMRGNHEGPKDLLAHPHDLPIQLQTRFGVNWEDVYKAIWGSFECMYNAVLVRKRYLLVHGGLSPQISTIKDLAYARTRHPEQDLLEDMLWSDPCDISQGACESPRGAGRLFGPDLTSRVLEKLGVKILIRGHEPCELGFKIDHNGKVLTLFSRKGSPYFNAYGAYLDLDLSEEFENAGELVSRIHRF